MLLPNIPSPLTSPAWNTCAALLPCLQAFTVALQRLSMKLKCSVAEILGDQHLMTAILAYHFTPTLVDISKLTGHPLLVRTLLAHTTVNLKRYK